MSDPAEVVERLRKRAEIRRAIGRPEPDRTAILCDDAAAIIESLTAERDEARARIKTPASCACKFDEDDNQIGMCNAHKEQLFEARAKAIEECAKVADDHFTRVDANGFVEHGSQCTKLRCNESIAKAIRALKDKPDE